MRLSALRDRADFDESAVSDQLEMTRLLGLGREETHQLLMLELVVKVDTRRPHILADIVTADGLAIVEHGVF